MAIEWTKHMKLSKKSFLSLGLFAVLGVGACSVNPATGDRQFTALLPAEREEAVGAQEHEKIRAQLGNFMTGPIAEYVEGIGERIVPHTERKDVEYKFFVIDDPMINAFAVPGGYIYVSRGLMALANSEAELAAVIAHEIGHVTARHSAERVSQSFLVGLGAAAIGAVAGDPGISQAAGLGSELFVKSYSRTQEHEADNLGVRYSARAGYDPNAMSTFLKVLDGQTKLDSRLAGRKQSNFNYFSTHPVTSERVSRTSAQAKEFSVANPMVNRDGYLRKISDLTYGDSADQGFVRGNTFYHPEIGFKFTVPESSKIVNSQKAVTSKHPNGTIIIFDMGKTQDAIDPLSYIKTVWLRDQKLGNAENITVNGMRAATASFTGTVQNRSVTIRLVAIEWSPGKFFRFQMAIPKNVNSAFMDELKKTTYSFKKMTASEKQSIRPKRIQLVTAKSGDSFATMGKKMAVDELPAEQFMALNGLTSNDRLVAGRQYKIIVN
ncbi:MAG: M48 family metalloprotease [Pseudomonadota bacterium]